MNDLCAASVSCVTFYLLPPVCSGVRLLVFKDYIEVTFKKQRPSVDHVRLESMTSYLNHFIFIAHTSYTQGN